MSQDRIVAIGLLTEADMSRLGDTFTRLWPVEEATSFDALLAAIDEASQQLQGPIQSEPSVESRSGLLALSELSST